MNRLIELFVSLGALLFIPVILSAQVPGAIKYQAVARDNTGQVLSNQDVSMMVSIISGNPLGIIAYAEIHYKKTNEYGLINLEIGNGTVISGDFNVIKWGEDKFFLKVEMDPAGGSSFEEMGTSQILSVPYALFAGEAANVDDADSDPTNEFQVLIISNDTLYLTNGGFIKLPSGNLSSAADLDTTGIKIGDILSWDGTRWIPVKSAIQFSYYYADRDEDGYGDGYSAIYSPEAPSGYVVVAGDCKDYDPEVYLGHQEDCDGKDNDCDGEIDEGCDQDDDGLKDYLDNCPYNFNPGQENFDEDEFGDVCDDDDDNDGVPDVSDNCQFVFNPQQQNNDGDTQGDECDSDDDNDNIMDVDDNCPFTANNTQNDSDYDGIGDACDPDDDNDDIMDGEDNCPFIPNTSQTDTDGDGQGDVCDMDDDNDTVMDGIDNCPLVANTSQTNTDGDAQGDACDPDDDNDGIADASDNCPLVSNVGQQNNDGDALGDACDSDDDNDTVLDINDNCQFIANTSQSNNDGDAMGDACDPDDDNDGVMDVYDNCPLVYNPDQKDTDMDGVGDVCDPTK